MRLCLCSSSCQCLILSGFYYLDQAWLQSVHQGQWEVGKRRHRKHRPWGGGQNPGGGHGIFWYVKTPSTTSTVYRKHVIEMCCVCVQLCSGSDAMSCRTSRRSWLRLREERPESRGGSASRKHWTLKWATLLSSGSQQVFRICFIKKKSAKCLGYVLF